MKKKAAFIAATGIAASAVFPFATKISNREKTSDYAVTEQVSVSKISFNFKDKSVNPGAPVNPDDFVTRAQLVQMVGVQGDVRIDYVSDLKRRHWAYDLLRHSKLRTIDHEILPDEYATREQAAVYIYDCYGNNAKSYAPSVVINNISENRKEIGWAYEHGIMVGNDGIHLRLDDRITKSEIDELISDIETKAVTVKDFADNVPEKTLEKVFNNSGLFETPYQADKVLTNGEAAHAAYKLYLGAAESLYYPEEADFEHEYADDLKAMEPILGEGRISTEFADSNAMPEDILAIFSFAMAAKVTPTPLYGMTGAYYPDAVLNSQTLDAPLTFAFSNGIYPYGGGVLKSGTPITHKTIASILLQYDMLWGIQSSVTVNYETKKNNDEPMRFSNLPENEEQFKGILQSVPNEVYQAPFNVKDNNSLGNFPVNTYSFCSDLKNTFSDYLAARSNVIYEQYGVKVDFTFYPQLVYDDGNGFVMRVKAEVKDAGIKPPTIKEIFPNGDLKSAVIKASFPGANSDEFVSDGKVIWTEFKPGYMMFLGY